MRRTIFACGLLLALAGIPSAVAGVPDGNQPQPAAQQSTSARADGHSTDYWSRAVQRAQAQTKHWLTIVRGRPPRIRQHTSSSAQTMRSLARKWHRRAAAARRTAQHPPERSAWNCIHHHEGAWTDPNAPYWGGLQMDYNFQSAYGAWLLKHKGTADHWAPLAQIWAGVRAWRVRGFEPWAGTAHACGVY
ncbi:MAG TPA: hypothetical protein VGH79_06720 [Gaiellaceae bacterium]|jgi:hypothetical protein